MSRGVDRQDLYTMRDKIHGEWICKGAVGQAMTPQLQGKERSNVLKRQHMDELNAAKMGQEEWYKMYFRPFHLELALVGMRVQA